MAMTAMIASKTRPIAICGKGSVFVISSSMRMKLQYYTKMWCSQVAAIRQRSGAFKKGQHQRQQQAETAPAPRLMVTGRCFPCSTVLSVHSWGCAPVGPCNSQSMLPCCRMPPIQQGETGIYGRLPCASIIHTRGKLGLRQKVASSGGVSPYFPNH